jgi:hypothetical protein
MKNEFKKIATGKYIISIPRKYKIKKHNLYLKNILFFLFLRRKLKKDFSGLPTYWPDLKALKGLRGYEVEMGTHSFIFFTETGDKKLEDLGDYIALETRCKPILKDLTINGCPGKMYGDYSEQMTWINWWIKKGDCMICLNIQGIGMPSQAIKDGVSNILNSLEYKES